MRASLLASLLCGCGFTSNGVGGGPEADCVAFSSQSESCTETFGGDLNLNAPGSSYKYQDGVIAVSDGMGNKADTITPTARKMVNGIDILFVHTFTLGSGNRLGVRGPAPFGIVSKGAITIDGAIMVESGRRDAGVCGTQGGAPGISDSGGGGGGGGGGFQGQGSMAGSGMVAGGAGGMSAGLTRVVGGCAGGKGGNGVIVDGVSGGNGGMAGGAIYFASGTSISSGSSSSIDAGGDGGGGGKGDPNNGMPGLQGGGGGGGSGGSIWFEAPMITVRGKLGANGGSGGEGAGDGGASSAGGAKGLRGLLSVTAAAGGSGEPTGGDGGAGGVVGTPAAAGSPGSPGGGGGGGGGGIGYIKLIGTTVDTTNSVISPAPEQ